MSWATLSSTTSTPPTCAQTLHPVHGDGDHFTLTHTTDSHRKAPSTILTSILSQMTVYESLVFSGRLRHSRGTDLDIIFAFVQEARRSAMPSLVSRQVADPDPDLKPEM